ncbi:MAG: serine hydrolase [Candidatus Saccharimonadales bacterium]
MAVYDDKIVDDDQLSATNKHKSTASTNRASQSVSKNLGASETSSSTSSNSGSGQNVSFSPSQLKSAETNNGTESDNFSFYNDRSKTSTSGKLKSFFWGSRRRKQVTVGSGLTSMVIGSAVFGITLFGGTGFEFIHMAQLLTHFHFSTAQNQQDSQFTKMVRYAKDIPNGVVERSRMGYLGNKFADFYETKLNASGLSSAYTKRFGLFDGYVVDPEKLGLPADASPEDIKTAVSENFGVEPTLDHIKGSLLDGKWVIDASGLSAVQTYFLNYKLLKASGLNGVSAAIGARLMCVRASCDWHPLSSLKTSAKRLTEEKLNQQQEKEAQDAINADQAEEATGQIPISPELANQPSSDASASDQSAASQINSGNNQLSTEAEDANKNSSALSSLTDSLNKKLILGGASLIGVLCILKNLDSQIDKIKQKSVELPLMRMGVQAISVGNQIMDGKDVNANELSILGRQLYGKDSQGKFTDWSDSKSIQENLGNTKEGEAPSSTLTSIAGKPPFAAIDNNPIVGKVCSTAGQLIGGVLSIAIDFTGIGALAKTLVTGSLQGVAINSISSQAAAFLSGKPVNVKAVGADYGNNVDFGAALAANQQQVTAGGTALSTPTVAQLQSQNNIAYSEEQNSQSLTTKLFSSNDPNSITSTILADSGPTLTDTLRMFVSHLSNIGSTIMDLPKLLFGRAYAQSSTPTGYNYPFPTYGFSEQDLNNPAVSNPYTNAEYVINNILDNSSISSNYIQKAASCFGVTISQVNQQWDVTAPAGQPNIDPYSSTYGGINCNEPAPPNCTNNNSDPCNWLRLRLFILDTETQNSMGCYAGDDQACSDIGMQTGSSANANTSSLYISAAQQVAQNDSKNGTTVGFALYDSKGNQISSFNGTDQNYGASITKSMLLVAYLNQVGSGNLSSEAQTNLTNMIENSDNSAANWVYSQLTNGPQEIQQVASQAGMTGFVLNTSDPQYILNQSQITANDFAKFFANINNLITPNQQQYGLNLLSNLSSSHQVGLLKSGLPSTVYSLEGRIPEPSGTQGSPYVVNQAAQFTLNNQTYGVAVTVSGTSDQSAGESIVQDVVSALMNNSVGGT